MCVIMVIILISNINISISNIINENDNIINNVLVMIVLILMCNNINV